MAVSTMLCTATRKDGRQCQVAALPSTAKQPGGARCFAHSDRAVAGRSAGGKARSLAARWGKGLPPHLADVQERLISLLSSVEADEIAPRAAEVIATIARTLLDFAKFQFEYGEQRELMERIKAIEAQLGEGSDVRKFARR